jgi:hypothetical protein
MVAAKEADSNLSDLDSNSKVAIWNLWIYIVAAAINILEQLQDVYQAGIELIASKAIAGTPKWVQAMTFKWQYDDSGTNPQVLTLNDGLEASYPSIVPAYQIATRCSVSTGVSNLVSIKVAKDTSTTDSTPIELTTTEEGSLTGYWAITGFAGVTYTIVNKPSDKIGITGTVYYQGQYSSTIQTDVELALNDYLANIDFAGQVRVSKIEDAIQEVNGVIDYKVDQIICRDDATTPPTNGVKIFDLATSINLRIYSPIAGYIIQENTLGSTFSDTITYTAQ